MTAAMSSKPFAPYHSSPLASSATEHHPASPSTPRRTAKLWDEYEKRAIENAKRRETTCGAPLEPPSSRRSSSGTVVDIIRSYDPTTSATSTPRLHFDFPVASHRHSSPSTPASATALAICKTCKEAIDSTSGICQSCMRTIIISPSSGSSTPLLSPCSRNFASTDLPKLHKDSASGTATPTSSSSPKRKAYYPPSQLTNPPIRLSSLHALAPKTSTPSSTAPAQPQSQTRKTSLTDPNEPFLRLQISRTCKPLPATPYPSTPTTPLSTVRPSLESGRRKRPSSLRPIATSPQRAPGHGHAHAHSLPHYPAAYMHASHSHSAPYHPSNHYPSYPYRYSESAVSATTSPPSSLNRASYSYGYVPQNAVSAWDDWDSDEEDGEGDKVGLVGYWRGRWRGSRGSLAGGEEGDKGGKKKGGNRGKKGRKGRKGGEGREENKTGDGDGDGDGDGEEKKVKKEKRRSGFVRVISCGWLQGCGAGR